MERSMEFNNQKAPNRSTIPNLLALPNLDPIDADANHINNRSDLCG